MAITPRQPGDKVQSASVNTPTARVMDGAVYDPAGHKQDVFGYVDRKIDELEEAVPGMAPVQSVNGLTGAVTAVPELKHLGSNVDFNSVIKAGMYRFDTGCTPATGIDYGQLLVVRGSGDTCAQIAFPYMGGASWSAKMRWGYQVDGTSPVWEPWRTIRDSVNTIQSDNSVWVGSSYDLNNFFSGVVLCYSNVQHVPSADWWHVMASGTSGTAVQIAAKLQNNGQMMTRRCAGGTWSAWEPLIGAAPPTRIAPSSTTLSVASGTTTTLKSVSLSPGIYVVSFGANFANNSTGYRAVCMSTTTSFDGAPYPGATRVRAASGTATWISCTTSFNITETTTIYFLVLHNAGSAINVTGSYSYVKLT